jgi:hypothetical protein
VSCEGKATTRNNLTGQSIGRGIPRWSRKGVVELLILGSRELHKKSQCAGNDNFSAVFR